jgi:ATP-dependent DNA ligase
VRVLTRNGHDSSDRYSSIVSAASNLRCRSAIIDGEAIVQDGNGASDFDALNSAMRWLPDSIILYAFDLMHLDGTDLRQQPLSVRRAIVQRIIGYDEEARPELRRGGFITLSDNARREFLAEVERLTTAWAAFKSSRLSDVKWCEPELKVRVSWREVRHSATPR